MANIQSLHAWQVARNKAEQELNDNRKRMERAEELARMKYGRKAERNEFEREQMERLSAQEYRNEHKRLLDRLQMMVERQRELQKTINEQGTASVTGIGYPTAREFNAALQRVQYNNLNFHFAIAGSSGCGKSSLINSFLNLNPHDVGAAPTGVTETTLEMGRYPDPGTQPPRPWTVWYDIPGAGTQRISDSQYFTAQALFVFDVIMVVIGNRFLESDCQIIRCCLQFTIPFFIVRSKSDQEITNMMRDKDEDYQGPFNSGELFLRCRKEFREESQKMVTAELKRATLPDQVLYCVSKRILRDVYAGFLEQSTNVDDDCHELALVTELMTAVYERRGGGGNTTEAPEVSQTNVHAYFCITNTNIRTLYYPATIPSRRVVFRRIWTPVLYTEGSDNYRPAGLIVHGH